MAKSTIDPPSTVGASLLEHSAALPKELGLPDLVLAQLLIIIVPDYLGIAVKAGTAHVFFWIAGIVLFFLPLAMVVMHMSRLLPLEGGLYEWVRVAFNDQLGFMVAWNLWLYAISYVGISGLLTVSFASYAIPGAAGIVASKSILTTVSVAMVVATMVVAAFGLSTGKWLNNAASLAFLVIATLLIVLPLLSLRHGTLTEYHPLSVVVPPITLFSASVFSKMTFGALCGFEYVAALAGECRNPKRDLPCSVLLTVPVIALVYVLATSAIQVFVSPAGEDMVAPIAQALSRGSQLLGISPIVAQASIVVLFLYYLATFCILFGVCTRLPMVAGWDRLVPAWFSHLHPRYKTPVNSILVLGTATLMFGLGASISFSPQEAFQFLLTCSFTFYALAYLGLFAIPLFSPEQRGLRPGLWLRLAAGTGFLVTLLFVVLAVVPIIDLDNSSHYSLRIAVVVTVTSLLAWVVYRRGSRKVGFASPAVGPTVSQIDSVN